MQYVQRGRLAGAAYNREAAGFLEKTFKKLSSRKVWEYFEHLGVFLEREEEGKIFPVFRSGRDVARLLAGRSILS